MVRQDSQDNKGKRMLEFKENDIVEWQGQKGVVQYRDKGLIYVFFPKTRKSEIFNIDGSKRKKHV